MGSYGFELVVMAYVDHNQYFDFPDLIKSRSPQVKELLNANSTAIWRLDDYARTSKDFENSICNSCRIIVEEKSHAMENSAF
jgi:hypothetical protein